MTFKAAYIKLTLFYVFIVMLISISFSVVIYRISYRELNFGLRRQMRILQDLPNPMMGPEHMSDLENVRAEQLGLSNRTLEMNLIYFNIIILFLSGLLSYWLARRTLKPIEQMVDAQNRFTADASHELRTPLTSMRTEIEVNLRDKKLAVDDAKRLLTSNLEEIAKLETLTNALLKLATYQDEAKLSFGKISLPGIIVEAYEKIEPLAKQKAIEFQNELTNIQVKGDKQSLIELFVILLDNAIKYSPAHSKVTIKIIKTDGYAEVSIKDRGIGIKASDLPYIFERFYRADTSRSKEKVSGYGLGLSIAKRIADLHGATISAKSKPGQGSEFTIKFKVLESSGIKNSKPILS